jgi:hypothetical protein
LFEHFAQRAEFLAPGFIKAVSAFGTYFHESSFQQASKLKRNGSERHIRHRPMDSSGAEFLVPHKAKDFAPARRGEHCEDGRL